MDWYTFLIILHIIGTAFGVGGATASDLLFLKVLKRGELKPAEFSSLKTLSLLVWTGLAVLVFSGFGFLILARLHLPEANLLYHPKLWAKLGIVLVILFNGLVMHWQVFPLLKAHRGRSLLSPAFIKRSSLALTTGAISFVSWYSALILGAWRGFDLEASFLTIFVSYLIFVIGAVIVSNIFGRYLLNSLRKKNL